MPDLKINRQSTLNSRTVEQVRTIYRASFPPAERTALSEILAAIERRERLAYVAQHAGCVVGFAIANRLPVMGIHLLAYLAVIEPMRGKGIGTALLRHVATDLQTQDASTNPKTRGMLIEVEPPDTGPAGEMALRSRRIQFYSRKLKTLC